MRGWGSPRDLPASESVANTREKCAASDTLAWPLPQPQSHTASVAGAACASHSNSSDGYPGRNSEYSHATVEKSCVLDMRTFYACRAAVPSFEGTGERP
jgi:hypothetical protein